MTSRPGSETAPARGKKGILFTLFLYLGVFCAVVLLVIWVVQTFLLDFIYSQISAFRMVGAADALAEAVTADDPEEEATAISVGYQAGIAVFTIDGAGTLGERLMRVEGEAGSTVSRIPNTVMQSMIAEARENGGSAQRTFTNNFSFGNNAANVKLPAGAENNAVPPPTPNEVESRRTVYVFLRSDAGGRAIAVFLDTAAVPIGTAASALWIEIAVLSLVFLLSALLLAFLMSRRIARPIAAINETAKALGAGHYDVHFEGAGYRETDELAATLNYAAEELSKVDDLQKELIANISHDLRTPLTMIVGYGEIMRDIEGENKPENVQVIIDEARRLSDLVNDLMTLSRYQSGCEKMQTENFDLAQTVREVSARYNTLLSGRGFTVTVEAEGALTVSADRARILQVIYNLMNNAVNYSGDARVIALICRRAGNCARVEVIDHGEGIPAEKLADIWQRYYKVDTTHKRSVVGSGLGLAIVRGILELHRARYGVDSKVGEGSRFWFELDLAEA